MAESVNTVEVPPFYRRLDGLNDELHIIRRLLEHPEQFHRAETMDILRMAVQYTHSRYLELACAMRREAEVM